MKLAGTPVHCNVLWRSRVDALKAPRGDIHLVSCLDCGHTFNEAFDPRLTEYTPNYENSLHFSETFQSYANSLAHDLVERYALREKDIVEIGCGHGDFLRLLCEVGDNRGTGFDPSYAGPDSEAGSPITIVRDAYTERYADYPADFVCCRHVLEHIDRPVDFLTTVRRGLSSNPQAIAFFEVPNAQFTLRDLSIWDIIYEHCSYFSQSSLLRAFSLGQYSVRQVSETYEGQFLCIEASPGAATSVPQVNGSAPRRDLIEDFETFADRYRHKLAAWERYLKQASETKQRIVVWGAGSKGISFLNTLPSSSQIEYVVDVNPRKHGKFIAGTGQLVVPPGALVEYQPDVIVVVNPIYENEIRKTAQALGLSATLVCA